MGGIRADTITSTDNVTGATVVQSFRYTDPANSAVSSGKPISLPMFGFTIPYTGSATGNDYWNYSTMRSANDLSEEDHTIMYEYVRETVSGSGSTLYQYLLPTMNWDSSAHPSCDGCITAEWYPTTDYIANPLCPANGSIRNDIDTYPFAPNPNYDFERGLVKTVTAYGIVNAGQLVFGYGVMVGKVVYGIAAFVFTYQAQYVVHFVVTGNAFGKGAGGALGKAAAALGIIFNKKKLGNYLAFFC